MKYYFVVQRPAAKPAPTPKPKEEEEDMDFDKLFKELTDAQAYTLLEKALRHAASQAEPDWSEKEGHWAKAAQTGVMNGEGPERPVKRDELAAVLGRLGLL